MLADYAAAARRCAEGGLDGCEIFVTSHLPGQFLSPAANRRKDLWGGSLENLIGPCGSTNFSIAKVIPGMSLPLASWLAPVRRFCDGLGPPVLHASRITDIGTAAHAVESGAVDLVGMTRAHMADPHLVAKSLAGTEARIRPCVGAAYCIDRVYSGKDALCLHNPATGRDAVLPQRIVPAPRARKMVVVGGVPKPPDLPGAALTLSSWDALLAPPQPEARVLVQDEAGEHAAMSCAEHLATLGARVTLATPDRAVGRDLGAASYPVYLSALSRHDVALLPDHRLIAAERRGNALIASLRHEYGGPEQQREVDAVIVKRGTEPLGVLFEALRPLSSNRGVTDLTALRQWSAQPHAEGEGPLLYRVGDAVVSRDIHAALLDSLRIVKDI